MMKSDLLRRLHEVEVLSSLSDEGLRCLDPAVPLELGAGEYLARQGDVAQYYWILLEGELRIYQTLAEGQEITLKTVQGPMALGELPLLANMPSPANVVTASRCELLRVKEDDFWQLMTTCPEVRRAILGNMAIRLQGLQNMTLRQEKMASLGTLAAGLMHELNNPGAAAKRAAAQLKDNLLRLHQLSAKFARTPMTEEQKHCMFALQEHAMSTTKPLMMCSLEQSDAEEALAEWLEAADVEGAWTLAPTLVATGIHAEELECARHEFSRALLSDALGWLGAMVSSMHLVGTIEESIGRVGDLVHAVKTYAYEGKGQRQMIDVNASIHATLVILAHKMREKEIVVEKEFGSGLPALRTEHTGLNQIWTNLLDNAIDAVEQHGRIKVRTWAESVTDGAGSKRQELCVSVGDDGAGIPLECQAHVFDPFFTTKEVGVGTGLGLGIVHRIVQEYGGVIHFASDAKGTEFVVRLPTPSE